MAASVNFIPHMARKKDGDLAPAVEVAQAVHAARIELGEEVIVVGDDARARLAAGLAQIAGAAGVHQLGGALNEVDSKSADVLIFASNDPRALADALRLVRNLGRVLLLGDIGAIDFDVYPDLHKRSIRLIGYQPLPETSPEIRDFVRHLVESGQLRLDSP